MKSTKFLQTIYGLASTTPVTQLGGCADDYDEVGSIPAACSLKQGDHCV